MFIDRQQLDALVAYQNKENPVVSVYLNVTPPRNYSTELNSLIDTTRQNLAERMDSDRLRGGVKKYLRKSRA